MSAESPLFVYLHGFASGPSSEKARFFRERLAAKGVELQVPNLNEGEEGFFGLTVSRALRQVESLLAEGKVRDRGAILIGSSLGGYLSALAASRNPDIRAVIMMAPAFDLPARWQQILGSEVISKWREEGSLEVDHYATRKKERIGFNFYRDSLGHPPYPKVECPGLILHGINDAEVPVSVSRKLVSLSPSVRLVEFDSDHALTDVLEPIWEESERFLAPFL